MRRHRLDALKQVDLRIARGEIFGLLGPNEPENHADQNLVGIVHPTSGDARVLDQPAGSRYARQRIGYLPEHLAFLRHHTGEGALYFYGRLSGLSESAIRKTNPTAGRTRRFGRRHTEPVRKYSKGMRQRLG